MQFFAVAALLATTALALPESGPKVGNTAQELYGKCSNGKRSCCNSNPSTAGLSSEQHSNLLGLLDGGSIIPDLNTGHYSGCSDRMYFPSQVLYVGFANSGQFSCQPHPRRMPGKHRLLRQQQRQQRCQRCYSLRWCSRWPLRGQFSIKAIDESVESWIRGIVTDILACTVVFSSGHRSGILGSGPSCVLEVQRTPVAFAFRLSL